MLFLLSIIGRREMDAQADEMLSKGLQAHKRKGKVPCGHYRWGRSAPYILGPPVNVEVPELPTGGKKKEKRKEKQKSIMIKVWRKAHPSYFLLSGHQLLTHIKMVNRLRLEALKVQEDHQVEVSRLQKERAIEVDRLMRKKVIEIEALQEVLKKEEQISIELKATLALEEEKKRKVEGEIAILKEQVLR
ncbi:hypothetical protein COCNU_scaffold004591G000010 [Cocos nucifera]|nr:hypothetical protein [Cocos nucifera]